MRGSKKKRDEGDKQTNSGEKGCEIINIMNFFFTSFFIGFLLLKKQDSSKLEENIKFFY
jgi:hypothetical protein